MNEIETTGTVVEFTAEESVDLSMNPSRPSKAEALQIGSAYFEAANSVGGDEADLDALLTEFGPILVRRSLKVFANLAARTGQREVAKFVWGLRDDITIVRGTDDEAEAAS